MFRKLNDKTILFLVIPALAYIVTFTTYPIISNFIFSFYTFNLLGQIRFVGLENYHMILQDPYMGPILRNTLFYMLLLPALTTAIALPVAVTLKRLGKLGSALLPIMVIPSFIPEVTAAVMWYLMLNPFFGIAYWLTPNYNWAASIWTVILIEVWRVLPMTILVIYSGLVSIPKEVEEAAATDGLTGPKKFFMVDFPLVLPQILISYVFSTLSAVFIFGPIWIGYAQAGPGVLDNLAFHAFEEFFTDIRLRGYAATLIFLLSIISTSFAILYVRLLSSRYVVKFPVPSFIPSKELRKEIHYIVISFFFVFEFLPLVWMILMSLKNPLELISIPPSILPAHPTLNNYISVLVEAFPYITTSLGVAGINVLITLILSTMYAYALAVHGFGKDRLLTYNFFIMATPWLIYIIPLYSVLSVLGLVNNWWGLVLTFPITTIPVSTWVMYNFYKHFPRQVDEAAQMDGMTKFKAFLKMGLPLSKAGLSVAAVYVFSYGWGNLIFPLAFTYSPYNLHNPLSFTGAQTFSVFIANLMTPAAANYVKDAAAGLISAVPPVLLVVWARNNLIRLWGGR